MSRQLALPFLHVPSYQPGDFVEDESNAAALAWLEAPWPGRRLTVWGLAGCGKTHFLHVWAERSGAALLAGGGLTELAALPERGGVAVDDADRAAERPLLHLLNAAAEAGLPMLLAARRPPSRWGTRLPDLASRLRATPAVELAAPGEAMLRTLFAHLLAERQLAVPEPVQDWLLLRSPRDPDALRAVAERLDALALAAGRRVTLALAAAALAGCPAEDDLVPQA